MSIFNKRPTTIDHVSARAVEEQKQNLKYCRSACAPEPPARIPPPAHRRQWPGARGRQEPPLHCTWYAMLFPSLRQGHLLESNFNELWWVGGGYSTKVRTPQPSTPPAHVCSSCKPHRAASSALLSEALRSARHLLEGISEPYRLNIPNMSP